MKNSSKLIFETTEDTPLVVSAAIPHVAGRNPGLADQLQNLVADSLFMQNYGSHVKNGLPNFQ